MCRVPSGSRHLLVTALFATVILATKPASAAFIVVTNDSVISTSTSVTRLDWMDFSLLGSDSDSASETFAGITSLPSNTTGSVSVTSTAAGAQIDADADIDFSLSVGPGTVGVFGTQDGTVYSDSPPDPNFSYFGWGFSSIFDVTFQLTSTYDYSLFFDVNGSGGTGGLLQIINASTSTVVDSLSLYQNNSDSIAGQLGPGQYRLRVESSSQSASNFESSAFANYSNAISGSFTEIAPVPVPAALPLFASAFAALAGVRAARRRA